MARSSLCYRAFVQARSACVSTQLHPAGRGLESDDQSSTHCLRHVCFDPQILQRGGDRRWLGILDVKRVKLATFWRVLRWMERFRVPFDELGNRFHSISSESVQNPEQLPREAFPIRSDPRPLCRTVQPIPGLQCHICARFDIECPGDPRNDAGFDERSQFRGNRGLSLGRIGSDQFQILCVPK